jgi:regulator of replication initiation timing
MSKPTRDLMIEIKQLKAENKALATENHQIKQKLQVLENNIDQKIAIAIKKAITLLIKQIWQLDFTLIVYIFRLRMFLQAVV